MQGFHAMGYFGGYSKVSRGPWFRKFWVEDDGLDWFYTFSDSDNQKVYLLSNNIPLQDRERLSHLYHTHVRNNRISWFLGGWISFEAVTKLNYCRTSALGWRFFQWLGMSFVLKSLMMQQSGQYYNPVVGAYFRKYQQHVKRDLFEIQDEKRKYFYIDTSQYMNYSNADLSDEYHVHHGPQPVSASIDFPDLFFVGRRVPGLLVVGGSG
jgi:hypothetical protein